MICFSITQVYSVIQRANETKNAYKHLLKEAICMDFLKAGLVSFIHTNNEVNCLMHLGFFQRFV